MREAQTPDRIDPRCQGELPQPVQRRPPRGAFRSGGRITIALHDALTPSTVPLQIRPYEPADWAAVGGLLEEPGP